VIEAMVPNQTAEAWVWSISYGDQYGDLGATNQQYAIRFRGNVASDPTSHSARSGGSFNDTTSLGVGLENQWYSIAAVAKAADRRTSWVNGVKGQTDGVTSLTHPQITTILWGGLGDNSETYDTGNVAQSLLYNRVLTPTEIRQLHVNPLAPFERRRRMPLMAPAVAGLAPAQQVVSVV
jgi:hypothetical protein